MSGLSTHVLDTASGKPAAGLTVRLYQGEKLLNTEATNADGRIARLLPLEMPLATGTYRMVFDIANYCPWSFFPEVAIMFDVKDSAIHYHVPLLLSPFGYSTYRGS